MSRTFDDLLIKCFEHDSWVLGDEPHVSLHFSEPKITRTIEARARRLRRRLERSRSSAMVAAMSNPQNPWIDICPGIKRRTVTTGQNMYQMLAQLDAGSRMPEHKHPQEQIVHVLTGRMRLIVAGVPHELQAGEAFYLASNVPHGVETIEETTVLDTFSPPREDLLAMDVQARNAQQ